MSVEIVMKEGQLDTKNEGKLNKTLTKTLFNAKTDINDLTRMTRKKLGKKALKYQNPYELLNKTDRGEDGEEKNPEEMRNETIANMIMGVGQQEEKTGNNNNHSQDSLQEFEDHNSSMGLKRVERTDQIDIYRKKIRSAKLQPREHQLLNQLIITLKNRDQGKHRKGISEGYFREVFLRTTELIEHLWEEMHISAEARDTFAKMFFYPETITNYVLIFKEISKLCRIRALQHEVLTTIEQREAYIFRLKQIVRKSSQTGGLQKQPMLFTELQNLIEGIVHVSEELIHKIVEWRDALPRHDVFLWDGKNYILKMEHDLDFLKLSEIASLFPFSLENNPMMLPDDMRCDAYRRKLIGEKKTKKPTYFTSTNQSYVEPTTPPKKDIPQLELAKGTPTTPSSPLKKSVIKLPPSDTARSMNSFLSTTSTKRVSINRESPAAKYITRSKALATPSALQMYYEHDEPDVMIRIQEAEAVIADEQNFVDYVRHLRQEERSASKIQTVVRGFLARRRVRSIKKEQYENERHRQLYMAKIEREQATIRKQHHAASGLGGYQKKRVEDDESIIIGEIPDDVDAVNLNVQDDTFTFLSKYNRNGRYTTNIFTIDNN